MIKRNFIYFLILIFSFFPIYRSYAVFPAVTGVAYAINLAVPVAIRYIGTEIAISSVVRAVQYSNAYYAASSRITSANYIKYFKNKYVLGAGAFVAALDALGLYLSNDSFYLTSDSSGEIGSAESGFFWSSVDGARSSASEVIGLRISSLSSSYPEKTFTFQVNTNTDTSIRYYIYTVETGSNGETINAYHSARTVSKYSCIDDSNGDSVASCQPGYDPNSNVEIEDSQAQSMILSYLDSLDDFDEYKYFADENGVFDSELVKDIDADNPPPMPDGSPIPDIGDPSWGNAHLVSTGVAQSSDSTLPNYVSVDEWDESYFLANDVAGGNDYITGINSGSITAPEVDTGDTTPPTTGDGTNIIIDVSGIERRLDISNEISSNILDGISNINNSSVELQTSPDSSVAKSFWPVKYTDGLLGVLIDFVDNMKQTPIFQWLNEFVIDLGSGSIPVFDFCFNVIAGIDFGCYTLQADAYIWSAIKACMILSSVIVSRRIVFGG